MKLKRKFKTLVISGLIVTISVYMILSAVYAKVDLQVDNSYEDFKLKYEGKVLGQRKPKTTNIESENEIIPEQSAGKSKRIMNQNNALNNNVQDNSEVEQDYNQDESDDQNDDNEYENDEYENDEENNEENERQKNNFHENMKDVPTNAPFKAGDFGDYRGLEYYKKPRIRYEEVTENAQDVNNEDVRKNVSLIDGIFWSQYVEGLIPKGKTISKLYILHQSLHVM